MARIFISHSSANNAAALALASWLEAEGWSDYFLDIDENRGISAGERWIAALAGAVDRCEAVIFLVSPAWRDSKQCFAEFFDAKKLGKRIFGVIVEPVPLTQLPEQMTAEWQVCDLTSALDPVRFNVSRVPAVPETSVSFPRAGLNTLARGLQKAGLDPSTFLWPPEAEPRRPPYPGLRALDEADAAVFFGRDAAIVRAIDQLRLLRERGVEQLFVILGASGSGKSSFLRAGLLPRLRRDGDAFIVLPPIRPERAAMSGSQGLLSSLKTALAAAGHIASTAQVRADLQQHGLAGLLGRIAAASRDGPTLLISVDQAEELSAADGHDEALQFFAHVGALAATARSAPRFLFVLTMRSDSLPRLQEEPAWQALAPVFFSLHAMPATEFKAVIEGPARRHTETVKSLVIEPRLVEQLVIDAQGADALPLLALTLEWLYREFTNAEGTRVGKDEYDGLGGVRGVIDIAVKRAFERPDAAPVIPVNAPSQERLLHQVFPAIATVDPDSGEWKRRVAVRESLRAQATQADAMVSRLIEQRLLVADLRRVAAGGEPVEVFEVAHETLLRQWEALRRWLTEFAEALSAAESLRCAANDWQRHERDEVMLVHAGHRLEAAEALVADARLQGRFELIDRDYVAACRQRAQREADDREAQLQRIAEQQAARATLQRRAAWVLSVTALLVLGLVGWIVVQTRAVSVQTSLVLAGAAEAAAAAALSDQSMRLAVLATRATWLHPAHANAGPALSRAAESRTLRIVLGGHGAAVRSATFSSDGQRILTVSNDETARLLNAETGAAIGAPMTHAKRIVSAGFSANGERIVTASSDQGVRVWDGATGNALGPPLDRGHAVAFAGLSPDGKRLITGLHNQTARIWDAGTGKAVGGQINYFASSAGFRDDFPAASVAFRSDGARAVVVAQTRAHILDAETGRVVGEALEHGAEISSATFSPDGKWIVTSSWDKTARVWDAETGKQIGEPMKHIDGIVSASFSPGSDRVVTASRDWTANVWDAATGKSISGAITHAGAVSSAVFSNDGRRVLTASTDTTARLWDSETGQSIGEPLAHADEVLSASFSPNDKRIVTASKDRHVRIWDTEPNKIVTNAMAHKGSVSAVSFSADGKRIVTAANDDNSAHLWNAETAESIGEPMTHERPVTSVSFSRDGTRVVTASGDSTARIWDAYTGRPIVSPMMHDHVVWSAEFSPDDRRVVTASADKTARLWDVETGRMVGAVMKHGAAVSSARFSAEGKRIVTASQDKTARLWDAETGKALGQPMVHVETVLTARFSPDDKRVVSGSEDKTARIWDGETGATIGKPIVHEDVVFFADFSPDGKHILTGSGAAARMWDATGASVGEPMLHQGDLAATQYSLDGRRIVTGSADRTARVWDAATGKPMGLPMTHGRVVSAVSFSPDGQRVVTGSWDWTARVWSASWPAISDPETLIAEACRKKLPGNLRRLTEVDIRAAPIITVQRVGEDVCAGVAEREK